MVLRNAIYNLIGEAKRNEKVRNEKRYSLYAIGRVARRYDG